MQDSPQAEEGTYWFAVQTKPRQEQLALDNLERQEFTCYLPKILLRKRRRQQWVMVTETLFPNYLFIQVDPTLQSLAPVRSTFGVSRLVRFGMELKPVPDEVIAFLQAHEDIHTRQRIDEPKPMNRGDKVEILSGPFEGLTAVYDIKKSSDRALFFIDLLGRQTPVTIHVDDVIKLS